MDSLLRWLNRRARILKRCRVINMRKRSAVFHPDGQSRPILRPEALRAFARVAELASFTKAAESLGLPKGRVSAAVQRLERQTSTQLLHRTTRRVQLTHDGQMFYERCTEVLADLDELQSMFEQQPQSLQGKLRVDMPSG